MGLTGSATTTLRFEGVRVAADRRLGAEGDGLRIALAGLDSGRLGIAAVATGLAQGALDHAVAYAQERETFGSRIIDHQGLAFVLADMAAAVETARAATLHAARLRDRGLPFSREASIAKLVATDNAMKVTTDAVQVLGGYGYTRDFPVERYMREAKVMQIFEGTNQIQRMVIARHLDKNPGGDDHGRIAEPRQRSRSRHQAQDLRRLHVVRRAHQRAHRLEVREPPLVRRGLLRLPCELRRPVPARLRPSGAAAAPPASR